MIRKETKPVSEMEKTRVKEMIILLLRTFSLWTFKEDQIMCYRYKIMDVVIVFLSTTWSKRRQYLVSKQVIWK